MMRRGEEIRGRVEVAKGKKEEGKEEGESWRMREKGSRKVGGRGKARARNNTCTCYILQYVKREVVE